MTTDKSLSHYDAKFYSGQMSGSARSARVVVPYVMELINPQSAVDLGCGTGTWLSIFKEHGVQTILGVDGDWCIPHLQIDRNEFVAHDISNPVPPVGRFDLAISLEAGEHIHPNKGPTLVESLTQLAPVVLFSAAVPFQGGTNHLNEQWPQYWAELFAKHNYLPLNCLRNHIWDRSDVQWWYAQNAIIYADQSFLRNAPLLSQTYEKTCSSPLAVIHPQHFLSKISWLNDPANHGFGALIKALPRALLNSLAWRR